MKQTCILILGMHRSGTSAFSGAMQTIGLSLGSSLMSPGKDNPKGYFENKKIYKFNDERLLNVLNYRWDDQALLKLDWDNLPELTELYTEAAQLITQEYGEFTLFGIKDPRMCLLLPFWYRVFKSLNVEIKVIFVFRNPLEIADSLFVRNGFNQKKSLGLSTKYLLMGEFNSRKFKRIFVSFDQLLNDAVGTLDLIIRELDVSLSKSPRSSYKKIQSLLDIKLKHSTREINFSKDVPVVIKKTALTFNELVSDVKKESSCLAKLNLLRKEFEVFSGFFGEEELALTLPRKELNNKKQEISTYRVRIDELKYLIEKRDKKIEQLTLQEGKLLSNKERDKVRTSELKDLIEKRDKKIEQLTLQEGKLLNNKEKDKVRVSELKVLIEKRGKKIKQLTLQEDKLLENGVKDKTRITELKELIKKRNNQIQKIHNQLNLQSVKLSHAQSTISEIYGSSVWRTVTYFSKFKRYLRRNKNNYILPLSSNNSVNNIVLSKAENAIKPINVETPKSNVLPTKNQYIIITCWLPKFEKLHEILNSTIQTLNVKSINSLVFTSSKEFSKIETLNSCLIHFLLSRHNSESDYPEITLPVWMKEVIALEKTWINVAGLHVDKIEDKCIKAFYFWHHFFLKNTPAFCLIWGSTAPLSRVLIKLSQEFNIPFLVVERGHFPGTMFIDTYAQLGLSSINRQPQTATLKDFPLDEKRLRSIIEWEKHNTNVTYQERNKKVGIKKLLNTGAGNKKFKKIVLFIGANDLGSGCAYSIVDTAESHCPLFDSSHEAFMFLSNVISTRFPEVLLLLKAHPNEDVSVYQKSNSQIIDVHDYNINELISISDVAVSLSSTAFAKCILEETPVLTLAKTDLAFKDIAYECYQYTDISVMLAAALEKERFDTKSENGFRYIQYLFDEKLLALDDEIPTRMHSENFSEYLSDYITNFRHENTVVNNQINYILKNTFNNRFKNKEKENLESLPSVDVIIPIYRDVDVTKSCIDSVLKERKENKYNIIIVNDNSPILGINEILESYVQNNKGITVLTNTVNIGFPASVNKGMRQSITNDVIILNSDTIVTDGWVEKLQLHAYKNVGTATVTPLSNNATIFSFPTFPAGSEISDLNLISDINTEMTLVNKGKSLEVPVGHGFCMFIKRHCIRTIGYFDEVTFGRGYSEEVDFCMRARSFGFVHRVALDVFIAHVGGVSFNDGQNKEKMKKREIIKKLYPNYFNEIKKFIDDDPIKPYRDAITGNKR